MEEAGYAKDRWEDSAGILAGWDIDQSPTIQTRVMLSKPLMSRRTALGKGQLVSDLRTNKWAARIRATRTVDEAWASFLSFKNDNAPKVQDVYYAIFEKLVFEGKLRKLRRGSRSQTPSATSLEGIERSLPGDSLRVYERPGPNEAIYVPTPAPDPDSFFDLMLEDRLRPQGRFLAFILKHATSFRSGVRYLGASALPPRVVDALLTQEPYTDGRLIEDIHYMSDQVFAAIVHFLTRFAPRQTDTKLPLVFLNTRRWKNEGFARSHFRINPLHQAFRLLLVRRPFYRPPWNSALSALARSGVSAELSGKRNSQPSISPPVPTNPPVEFGPSQALSNAEPSSTHDIRTWGMIRVLVRQMENIGLELDFAGFHILCVGLEKALYAAMSQLATSSDTDEERGLSRDTEEVLGGHAFLKNLFKRLVSTSVHGLNHTPDAGAEEVPDTPDLLPQLLEVPMPAHLHSFIRVLGLREDHQGIQDTIEWMSSHAPDLQALADETSNGQRMLRRCLIAARVFLEQSWSTSSQSIHGSPVIRDTQGEEHLAEQSEEHKAFQQDHGSDILGRVYQVIEQTEQWGGWPRDEEVETYCRRTRRT